jgi:polysaccharide deacetylase family protein (PEP-CTERM system associated)
MAAAAPHVPSSPTMPPPVVLRPGTHIFTVDVEEYFHAHALASAAPLSRWHTLESRVVDSTVRLMDLLARHDAHATFFVLGWVADRHPALVRRIVAEGHEVASHGYWHTRVAPMRLNQFRDELRHSRDLLEQLTGRRVLGFRAPSFSIVPGAEWAFDIMLEEGITYDSSLFPIRRPGAGYPGCCPEPHHLMRPAGRLLELPLTTTVIGGMRLPAAGGAWLRHLPFGLVERAFLECAGRSVPGVFYMHPWEIDAGQPVLPGVSPVSRLRHYGGTHRMLARVEQLMAQFRFTSVERAVGAEHLDAAA